MRLPAAGAILKLTCRILEIRLTYYAEEVGPWACAPYYAPYAREAAGRPVSYILPSA